MSRKPKGKRSLAEVIRSRAFSAVPDLKATGELSKAIFSNMGSFRAAATEALAKEVNKVISKVDVSKLLQQILKSHTIRVEAKIEFEPKSKKGTR